ncbi:hypothetical protein [Affinirhizobium pseudoryzae]|uniref:hypothetical protein n=1 Tax=Allorhizobium pseudoryzae TaxID=379684 RepID=UPI0013ED4462|nr:hypothetical protein [Allorhizobium pseudoryzae]
MGKGVPEIRISREDRERLQRIAVVAADVIGGDDGRWLAGWLALILAGLPADMFVRDDALRRLYEGYTIGGDLARRDELRRLCRNYEAGRWRYDRDRDRPPPNYVGTRDELLFLVFRHSDGSPPISDKRLIAILSGDCFYKRNGRHKMRFSFPQ